MGTGVYYLVYRTASSGKSTLAQLVQKQLVGLGLVGEILDGVEVWQQFPKDPGFSKEVSARPAMLCYSPS